MALGSDSSPVKYIGSSAPDVVYARFPSRLLRRVRLCVEDGSRKGKQRQLPQYLLTTEHRTSSDFIELLELRLLSMDTKMKLKAISGRIRWLFILNASRPAGQITRDEKI